MLIECLTTIEQFDSLLEQWRELEKASPDTSIFMTWDWQRLWWKHYGTGRELRILLAKEEGKTIGIFPLYQETHWLRGLWRVRKLRQIGAGGDTAPDDLNPMLLDGSRDSVAKAFADHIIDEIAGWDLLDLVDLQPDAPFTKALICAYKNRPSMLNVGEPSSITYGKLPATWDEFLANLGYHRRAALRRLRRKFEQQTGSTFIVWADPSEIDAAFERLASLHRLRWEGRTDHPSFNSPQYLGFHRELMHALLALGRLRLAELQIGGRSIAMLYGYRLGNTFYYFQSGFDPSMAAWSPGELVVGYSIQQAIEEGCEIFDMLKGDYHHKRHYLRLTRNTVWVRAYRRRPTAALYRLKAWLTSVSLGIRRKGKRPYSDQRDGTDKLPSSHQSGKVMPSCLTV